MLEIFSPEVCSALGRVLADPAWCHLYDSLILSRLSINYHYIWQGVINRPKCYVCAFFCLVALNPKLKLKSFLTNTLFVLQASGGYNGLSSIKMEQDGMAPLGSMKVGLAFFPFSRVVPKVHYDMCSSFPRVYLAAHTSIETMRLPHRPIWPIAQTPHS